MIESNLANSAPAEMSRPTAPDGRNDIASHETEVVLDWHLAVDEVIGYDDRSVRCVTIDNGHLEAFAIESAISDGQAVVRLRGELDCATALEFCRAIDELAGRNLSCLVIEMSGLSFIDSSGLHELVRAHERQRKRGGRLILREPTAQTRRVLDISGLSSVITIN